MKSVARKLLEKFNKVNRSHRKVSENYEKINPRRLPVVISDGTMRSEDLVPALWDWAFDNEAQEKAFLREQGLDNYNAIFDDEDTMESVKEILWDICEKRAPEGFYFGTAEGDPACVGFFSEDEDYSESLKKKIIQKRILV